MHWTAQSDMNFNPQKSVYMRIIPHPSQLHHEQYLHQRSAINKVSWENKSQVTYLILIAIRISKIN